MNIFFFDIETTGLNPEVHNITSFAYIIYNNDMDQILEKRSFLVKRESYTVDPQALAINKVDFEKVVLSGMDETSVINIIKQKIFQYNCSIIGGYNVHFDYEFTKKLYPAFPSRMLDVYSLVLFNEGQSYKLEQICEKYGIEHEKHVAMSDIEATLKLYQKYKQDKKCL